MALIECPKCGNAVSDQAIKCPKCGKKLKIRKEVFVTIALIAVAFVVVFLVIWVARIEREKKEQETLKKEQLVEDKRLDQIDDLLLEIDEAYQIPDFDKIEECYDSLDALKYDTTKQRSVLEYDKFVYEEVYAYYVAMRNFDDALNNHSYKSLKELVDGMKPYLEKITELSVNEDSKLGRYIKEVQDNPMLAGLLYTYYGDNIDIDLDYALTQSDHVMILRTYTSELVNIEFPYKESDEKDNM
ncbi:MAG: zinc ribbon domain-containing protein [Lachnospiraceae bacterium]|nr:zinc ribbon domain-containing protein [Lachnospiraceae bacterium]